MRKKTITFLLLSIAFCGQAQWKPVGDKIKTQWGETVNPSHVLPEYPRPILERTEWKNLNGLWNYSILPVGKNEPSQYEGQILVPFAVESSLSGVQKRVDDKNELWYMRTFEIPTKWKGRNIILHFGAVDWKSEIFVNDIKIGSHVGGYAPFSFDITPYLASSKEQKLTVKVYDPTDKGYQPRGKQVSQPDGIWYTPVTGIWQTVWLEPVAKKHIAKIINTPDIDNGKMNIRVETENNTNADVVEVSILSNNKIVSKAKCVAGEPLAMHIPDAQLWSPENPFLYDMNIKLFSNGKLTDEVKSYCAMRKVSMKRDKNGIMRMQLNNKDYFHFGPLDQGWWPDGLYTAPSDEALMFDIRKTKELGYNMIRKHVKVEPARWYTHCDRIGMLVWQDMPNGDRAHHWDMHNYAAYPDAIRSEESQANFKKEWKEIMDYLFSYPSIAVWVPFNEAWGQFKTIEIVNWTKNYDPSRLVNGASGGNHVQVGDILDSHNYPGPRVYLYDAARVNVLGEYGGIGLPLQGHLWQPDKNWGYVQFKNSKEVTDRYIEYAEELKQMIKNCYSGAVYTQTTDVEGEVNGLITYDRKIVKMDEARLKKINQEICNSLNEK